MSDDFDDPNTALTKRLQRQRSGEDYSAKVPYSASTGINAGGMLGNPCLGLKSLPGFCLDNTSSIAAGDMFGNPCLSLKSLPGYYLDSTSSIAAGDMFRSPGLIKSSPGYYLDSAGGITVGDRLGSTGLGSKSSTDAYLSSTGITVGDSLRNTVAAKSSSEFYPSSTVLEFGYKCPSLKSSPVYLDSTGGITVGDRLGSTGLGLKSSTDVYLASTGINVGDSLRNAVVGNPSAEVYWPSTGINSGDRFGNTGHSLKSSVDLYSVSTGGTKVGDMLGSTVVNLRSTGLGVVTTDFSGLYQDRGEAMRLSPTGIVSLGQPLSVLPGGEYHSVARLPGLTGNFYEGGFSKSKRRRFEVWLPLQFNDGKDVPAGMIEEAKRELLSLFGGVSCETQTFEGLWEEGGVEYRDTIKRVIVDAPDGEQNRRRMHQYNERWRQRLAQLELYMTSYVIDVE